MLELVTTTRKMLEAGFDIVTALEMHYKSIRYPKHKYPIYKLIQNIRYGYTFSDSLSRFYDIHNLYLNIIKTGELTGTLEQSLTTVEKISNKQTELKHKIKKSTSYPLVLVIALSLTLYFTYSYIIPEYIGFYKEFNIITPKKILILFKILPYALLTILLVVTIFVIALLKYKNHYIIYKLPLMGKPIRNFDLFQTFYNLGISLKSGIQLHSSLVLQSNFISNQYLKHILKIVINDIEKGNSLSTSCKNTDFFPDIVIKMLTLAEQTGTLDKIILQLATIFEEDVVHFLDRFIKYLEPCLILIIGSFVGYVITTLYTPLINLASLM